VDKLRLDLETLEVERLDVAVTGLNGGLEAFGMGHGSTELGQSCEGGTDAGTCACTDSNCEASCNDTECDCDQ
jgi:hypothetical protein